MRESFGGAFMIKLVLVFIVIYVSFMAVAINYAKAFRVKNRIINILEQHQYKGEGEGDTTGAIDALDGYLEEVHYSVRADDGTANDEKCKEYSGTASTYYYNQRGVCVFPLGTDEHSSYYRVITFIAVDFPFFRWRFTFPIAGETKTIIF